MGRVRAVIFAVDELLQPPAAPATPEQLARAVEAVAPWCDVWLVGRTPLPLHPAAGGRVRRAASLEAAPAGPGTRGDAGVLVVGGRPQGAIRFANARHLTSALVAADGPGQAPLSLGEVPDFILPDVGQVPQLLARMERDEGDFQGVE
ncbi:MAG TPA: hypothetical protein VIK90_05400 [Limnochordales bacterium]